MEGCLRAGVPMLLYPQAGDHFPVSERVEGLGADIRLTSDDVYHGRLLTLAERVLTEPAFKRRAEEICQAMQSEGGAGEA